MNRFEGWQPAPPEVPTRGEGALRRLVDDVKGWRARQVIPLFAAAAMAGGFGALATHKAMESRSEGVPGSEGKEKTGLSREIDIHLDELRAMDPEASPERIRLIFGTLPDDFAGGFETIAFNEQNRKPSKDYGPELQGWQTMAETSWSEGKTKANMTFYGGIKTRSSEYIWGDTVEHEFMHIRDWRTARGIDAETREGWKNEVYERVQADDRHLSPYVEAITNQDPFIQLDKRAIEYWAVTGALYLAGKPLPPKDAALHERINALLTPNFNRDAALSARRIFLREMAAEEASQAYQEVPKEERASIEAWMEWRVRTEAETGDPAMQREGRAALLEAFERLGSSDRAALGYVITLIQYYHAREQLFEAKASDDGAFVAGEDPVGVAYENLSKAFSDLENQTDSYDGSEVARREIDDILNRYRIWIGGGERGMQPDFEEEKDWTEMQGRLMDILPIFRMPQQDVLELYLERKSFIPLEE